MSLMVSAGRGLGAVWSPTHVQVTVLQARGLRAKGPGGTSDAYAVIQVGKEKYATSVSERSLGAPVWREEATFELPSLLSSGAAAAATLQLTVLHRALLGLDSSWAAPRWTCGICTATRTAGRRSECGRGGESPAWGRGPLQQGGWALDPSRVSRAAAGKAFRDGALGRCWCSHLASPSAAVPPSSPSFGSFWKKGPYLGRFFLRQSLCCPVMSHKRTASTDLKQLNQVNFTLPKKEGLSFLGGLRSKNDVLSRSNVCINGNHVYLEQPEAKGETKDSSPSSSPSPKGFRKKHLFSSTENLAAGSWKEPAEGGGLSSDRQLSESFTKDSLKSMTLPSYRPAPLVSGDLRENTAPANSEATKEAKESKKPESRRSSLLSLMTGKKDVAKGSEGENPLTVPGREKEGMLMGVKLGEDALGPAKDLVRRSEKDTAAVVSRQGSSLNPFEDVQITEPEAEPESKSEPKPPISSPRAPQTRAVKPRLHPVKPMNATATKIANSSLGTATIISENLNNEAMMKKYSPSDPAFAYAQLTHDELIQLVLKQKETISKKEFQVRELEDYIDNLLVRVMEETPNILRIPTQVGKKAGKM
uniref:RAB11 family interacting protein 1 n=1 Tax=Nomascus leucogenys TaxID=61853 RepID=A0A2I3G8K0_NOMLE